MKKVLALVLALCMVFALCACGKTAAPAATEAAPAAEAAPAEAAPAEAAKPAVEPVTFKMSFTDPESSPYAQGGLKIAELVKEATDGVINIEVYSSSSLGTEGETVEMCANGELDIATCANSVLENYFPESAALEQPFLWTDTDAANYALMHETGKLMAAGVEKSGMHMIGFEESGFRNMYTVNPIKSYDDLQGLKIRTMGSDLQVAMWNSFGCVATPLASTEQFTALQQGTVLAVENAVCNDWNSGWYEVAPYGTWTNHYFCYIILCMSDNAYQKVVDLGYEDAFLAAVQEGCEYEWDLLIEQNAQAVENLEGAGVEFFTMPAEDIETLKANYKTYIEKQGITFDQAWQDAIAADQAAYAASK